MIKRSLKYRAKITAQSYVPAEAQTGILPKIRSLYPVVQLQTSARSILTV
jgi:hypothetical protein